MFIFPSVDNVYLSIGGQLRSLLIQDENIPKNTHIGCSVWWCFQPSKFTPKRKAIGSCVFSMLTSWEMANLLSRVSVSHHSLIAIQKNPVFLHFLYSSHSLSCSIYHSQFRAWEIWGASDDLPSCVVPDCHGKGFVPYCLDAGMSNQWLPDSRHSRTIMNSPGIFINYIVSQGQNTVHLQQRHCFPSIFSLLS